MIPSLANEAVSSNNLKIAEEVLCVAQVRVEVAHEGRDNRWDR